MINVIIKNLQERQNINNFVLGTFIFAALLLVFQVYLAIVVSFFLITGKEVYGRYINSKKVKPNPWRFFMGWAPAVIVGVCYIIGWNVG